MSASLGCHRLQRPYTASRARAVLAAAVAAAPARSASGRRRLAGRPRAGPDEAPLGEDLTDIMKQDLERFAARRPAASAAQEQEKQPAGGSPLKEAVDKVLIADFFFVLLVLAWLGAGLAEKGALHSSALLDAWMPLWPLVFQPAIGVLMLGALVSGGLSWLAQQQQQQQQ